VLKSLRGISVALARRVVNSTETGTVFHLMGCLSEFGKLGLTTIGNSPEEADKLFDEVVAALDAETSGIPLPPPIVPMSWL
ncbi:peptide ligase PGM1-related protein, partial [Baaleninema sp.]|uniref:peptide ligase PGM1-related protein n=1 Tax=Baaleninema sp. TaxID=3101197 RepID=UPI003D0536FA